MAANPFDHVLDSDHWHISDALHWGFHIPFGLSKFMVLELIAAVAILLIFLPIANRARSGEPPRGLFWNAFESLLTFIRDKVAKPYLDHDADKFVPFLWTLFLFILFCNLLGMFPFMGSPTASIMVTGALAVITFFLIHGAAVAKMGVGGYFKSYFPHMEIPYGMGYVLISMIAFIEMFGQLIKAFVLAVRLFANMMGGHTVLAVIMLFIVMAKDSALYISGPITIASVLGVTALSLLELFVAFLQAFIFTFLTAIFLGTTLHPAH